jgi:hypothetical protein
MDNNRQYTGTMIADLQATVENLVYASYKANRLRSPDVLPERWALIFPTIDELEERFQQEIQKGANNALAKIRAAAKADDREPSKWLRRQIVKHEATLFAKE